MPEIFSGVNILSQSRDETFKEENIKILNNVIKNMNGSQKKRLRFRLLDFESLKTIVYSDDSLDRYSQAWYHIFLADKNNNANLIEYASIKSRRADISVLGAETFGLSDACDAEITKLHEKSRCWRRCWR